MSDPNQPSTTSNLKFFFPLLVAAIGTGIEVVYDPGYAPLWPSLVALTLAILWRKIIPALLVGALAGAILAAGTNIFPYLIQDVLLPVFSSSWNLTVLAFTLLCGGFAGLVQAGGGLEALAARLAGKSRDPRRLEFSAFILGLLCFFDGLANSLIVGRTLRSPADRYGVSREKLAYIADSTSAPVACLALATTWVATQIGLIRAGLESAGVSLNATTVLIESIPANFYCWTALALVPLSIGYRWGKLGRPTSGPSEAQEPEREEEGAPSAPWRAWFPITFFVFSLILGLFLDGMDQVPEGASLAQAISYGDAVRVLLLSILFSSVVAFFCIPSARKSEARPSWIAGTRSMVYPLLILVAAWLLSATLKELQTAEFLAGFLTGGVSASALPILVFLITCLIAYTTGTSWGTMGLSLPLVIPIAAAYGGEGTLMVGVVAAALSGAVFGDHTSPFSDTTIISAVAAGCDPWDHVRTQWPYALTAGVIAALFGFLPLGFGLPAWIGLPLCLGSLWVLVRGTRSRPPI